MGKTRREIGPGYFRSPKGHKAAKVSGARSIPPSDWDDVPYSSMDEAIKPAMRYAKNHKADGFDSVKVYLKKRHSTRVVDFVMGCWERL